MRAIASTGRLLPIYLYNLYSVLRALHHARGHADLGDYGYRASLIQVSRSVCSMRR